MESEPRTGAALQGRVWELLRQAAREAAADPMSGADESVPMDKEEEKQDEAVCPEDQRNHDVVCPYTGRSYPEYRICPPAPSNGAPTEFRR